MTSLTIRISALRVVKVGNVGNYFQGFVTDCVLPASRRRVSNGSLEPRPSAEAIMNNRQSI